MDFTKLILKNCQPKEKKRVIKNIKKEDIRAKLIYTYYLCPRNEVSFQA